MLRVIKINETENRTAVAWDCGTWGTEDYSLMGIKFQFYKMSYRNGEE